MLDGSLGSSKRLSAYTSKLCVLLAIQSYLVSLVLQSGLCIHADSNKMHCVVLIHFFVRKIKSNSSNKNMRVRIMHLHHILRFQCS